MEKPLSIPHLRVLEALYFAENGALSRKRIAREIKKSETYVGRIVGQTKEEYVNKYLASRIGKSTGPSLAARGLAIETTIDVDGYKERVVQITPLGKEVFLKERVRLQEYETSKAERNQEKQREYQDASSSRTEETGREDRGEDNSEDCEDYAPVPEAILEDGYEIYTEGTEGPRGALP